MNFQEYAPNRNGHMGGEGVFWGFGELMAVKWGPWPTIFYYFSETHMYSMGPPNDSFLLHEGP